MVWIQERMNTESGHLYGNVIQGVATGSAHPWREGATMQMEGCITMGLGYALTEEIHFKDGELFDLNFDTYAIPTFSWLPKIETVILENPNLPPQGGGEPAIIGMGGVIATAIHDAGGAAVFQLPMTPERVKEALKRA